VEDQACSARFPGGVHPDLNSSHRSPGRRAGLPYAGGL